jgi:hypothetical protein
MFVVEGGTWCGGSEFLIMTAARSLRNFNSKGAHWN